MSAWSADFSYGYYRRLLSVLKRSFSDCLFRNAETALLAPGPRVFLRHDVDVSLKHAVRIAEAESALGIASTYMILPHALLYSLRDRHSRTAVKRIAALGHEVALHFDCPDEMRGSPANLPAIEEMIPEACAPIEDILGAPVCSLSFHRPIPWLLRGPIHVAGRVNAYAASLMDWYLSDSKGSWREGEPLPQIQHPRAAVLQLLTHPIWWGQQHREGPDRIEDFVQEETAGQPPVQVAEFRRLLAETLPGVSLGKCV